MKAALIVALIVAPVAVEAASLEEACTFFSEKYLLPDVVTPDTLSFEIGAFETVAMDLDRYATLVTGNKLLPSAERSPSGARQALSFRFICYADIERKTVLTVGVIAGSDVGERRNVELKTQDGNTAVFPVEINAFGTQSVSLKETPEAGNY